MRTSKRTITTVFTIVAVAALTTVPATAQEKEKTAKEKERVDRTVHLSEQNESGVEGEIVVYEAGRRPGKERAKHRVDMKLRGLESGETYRIHLHGGTCAEPGQVITPLARIEADDAGRGEANTELADEQMTTRKEPRPAATTDGEKTGGHEALFVQARLPDGTPVACGDVPLKKGEQGA